MRVFISSVMRGFEAHRQAAIASVRLLGHHPIVAEDFGASNESPQAACLQGVRSADVTVLLLGQRYGALQRSGRSATHEEYEEARRCGPVLVFIEEGVDREAGEETLVEEVEEWSRGLMTARYRRTEDLGQLVARGLRDLEVSMAANPADAHAVEERARSLLPTRSDRATSPVFTLVVAGCPQRTLVKPSALADADLAIRLSRIGTEGPHAPIDRIDICRMEGDWLLLRGGFGSYVAVDEFGTVKLARPVHTKSLALPVLIEEQAVAALEGALRFSGRFLDEIDPTRTVRSLIPLVHLSRGVASWRSQREHDANSTSATMSRGAESLIADLRPSSITRDQFISRPNEIAHDLVAVLRRRSD